MQKVIDLYNTTGLPPLAGDDLHGLFNDTEKFLYDKLTGNKQMHLKAGNEAEANHLPINRSKAMEMLTKPTGYNELLAGIDLCSKKCLGGFAPNTPSHVRFGVNDVKTLLVIDDKGALQFSDDVQKDIDRAGNVYANTDKGQAIYTFLQKVADAFKELSLEQYICNVPTTDIAADRIVELIESGITSINIESGKIRPVIHNTNNPFPNLPFDNNNI